MDTIKGLNFIPNAEKSIECNPGTVNEKKLSDNEKWWNK